MKDVLRNLAKRILAGHPRLYAVARRYSTFKTGAIAAFRGQRGAADHLRSTWSLANRSIHVSGRPMNITIEPTNICNLKCPVCETGAGILGRKDANMTLEQFQKITDEIAPHTNTLMFYFMGEPFLNKKAYEMIRYAKDKGIPWITTCTNGDPVNPEKLIGSGIDEVSFQIGGMTQETHQVYRINSKLERVLKNLKSAIELRDKAGVEMRITCGFILMKHNEHEVQAFKDTMAELGVDDPTVIDPCVRTVSQGHEYMPSDEKHWYYDIEAFNNGILRPKVLPNNECPWIWYSMSVHVNGDVVPCCRDPRGDFVMGNLLEQSLEEVWNGQKYIDFRSRVLNDQGKISICQLCSSYDVSAIK